MQNIKKKKKNQDLTCKLDLVWLQEPTLIIPADKQHY